MRFRSALLRGSFFLFLFFLLFPILLLLVWSFTQSWPWPDLLPRKMTLLHWTFPGAPLGGLWGVVLQSFLLGGGVTLLSLAISLPAAKALGLYSFPGKRAVELLVLMPVMVPPISYAPGMHALFMKAGLADSFWGVLLSHLVPCLPYGIRLLTQVYRSLGDSLEIQARVLGASPFQAFRSVTLPLLLPGILAAGGLLFIVSLSQYLLTFFLGGGRVITLAMALFPLVHQGERGAAAAWSVVFILVSLVFCLLTERLLKRYYSLKGMAFFS
jgi:putative spermidine/putrescine transport system permease protein